jgi:CDP-glucose 4,6-dehydratase
VIGLSLPAPETRRTLYSDAKIAKLISTEYLIDIRDDTEVAKAIQEAQPSYVFHLAAQALVRRSIKFPSESISTNVIGTANVLLASMLQDSIKGITIATTDKVYQNLGNQLPFKETDRLGSKDPYSASKAAAELVVASLSSTCNPRNIPVTTVRAGNVIGGGDWGEDRLVPDLVTALDTDQTVIIRNPGATRPWQYILDCLRGYLLIGQCHLQTKLNTPNSINFGSPHSLEVKKIIDLFELAFEKKIEFKVEESNSIEAKHLELNSQLAYKYLGWSTTLSSEEAIRRTANWYLKFLNGINAQALMSKEISDFTEINS